jgi:hypothetical protein
MHLTRWNVTLDPTVDRSDWTPELDKKLLELFKNKETNSWSKRAKALATGKFTPSGEPMRRSGADCCDRYFLLKKQGASESSTTKSKKRSLESESVSVAPVAEAIVEEDSAKTTGRKRAKK